MAASVWSPAGNSGRTGRYAVRHFPMATLVETLAEHGVRNASDALLPSLARPRRCRIWLLLALSAFLLVVGAAVVAFDASTDQRLLPGTRLAGVDVGGVGVAEAVRRADARLPDVAAAGLQLEASGIERSVTLGQLGIASDAGRAARLALGDSRHVNLLRRVWHRVTGQPLERDYQVSLRVDPARASALVGDLAASVDRPPVDAALDTGDGFVRVVPAVEGRETDQRAAVAAIVAAGNRLAARPAASAGSSASAALPVRSLAPAVTSFPHVLLVRLGENRLYHYVDGVSVKDYPVATGQPRYPTPQGTFHIVSKRRNPVWVNPDPRGWGRSMPARIGAGPRNPLGTRAMNLDATGIRIHGTSDNGSLGYSASHGCIRMGMPDVEELFELVPEGTPVVILSAGPPRPVPARAPPTSFDDPDVPVDLQAGG